MKAAIIQQFASADKDANPKMGLVNLSRAADMGASLVCFAELAFEPFYPQFPSVGKNDLLAENIPGQITDAFQEASATLRDYSL